MRACQSAAPRLVETGVEVEVLVTVGVVTVGDVGAWVVATVGGVGVVLTVGVELLVSSRILVPVMIVHLICDLM